MNYVTVGGLFGFAIYMAMSIVLLTIFTLIYMRITPHDDVVTIKENRVGPAIALVGAMIGFTIPISSLSYHGVNLFDFAIWTVIAGIVQLVLFKFLYRILPLSIDKDNQAVGMVYAGGAICIGMLNAVSLIPSQ